MIHAEPVEARVISQASRSFDTKSKDFYSGCVNGVFMIKKILIALSIVSSCNVTHSMQNSAKESHPPRIYVCIVGTEGKFCHKKFSLLENLQSHLNTQHAIKRNSERYSCTRHHEQEK